MQRLCNEVGIESHRPIKEGDKINDCDPADSPIDSRFFLNSRGFGGNDVAAIVLSSQVINTMLAKRYSKVERVEYQSRRGQVRKNTSAYDTTATQDNFDIVYYFG
jgi:acetoacetyl-[acyl-carrier protein] synthase